MKYALLIYGNEAAWDDLTANGREKLDAAHSTLLQELKESGEHVMSNELSETNARVVRRNGERLLVTDGPFVETKEIVGGFYIVECANIERAVEIAGRLEETTFSVVEVRELMH
jgi:hypothetical protein